MPYVSKAEIAKAREPDLLTFLQSYNPQELVPCGNGVFSTKTHSSLKISNGKWCWWAQHIGGDNALEYLIKVNGMAFMDAVLLVRKQCGFPFLAKSATVSRHAPPQKSKQQVVLPEPNSDNRRVIDYLLSRGIHMEIIDYCIQTGRLYEDAKYHNAVFVGTCGDEPRYASIRGTLKGARFMREAEGSDKAFCFAVSSENPGATLNVFEGAIDALSFMTMLKMQGANWHEQGFLSLGGVYKQNEHEVFAVPIALGNYLARHLNIEKITLRLDNDEIGRAAAQSIIPALEGKKAIGIFPEQGKDYNEWLMIQKGLIKLPDIGELGQER